MTCRLHFKEVYHHIFTHHNGLLLAEMDTNKHKILVAPFVLRAHEFANDKILPKSLAEKLNTLPAYSKWAKAVISQESVTYIWDRESMIERTYRRAPEMRKKFGISK